ncbi:acid stress-induced BolA-like protein IbaG/YrbA [Alteromonadaceae bacterium 2753L.S.0a.02]|nr:acid stress-induced BolA-like protein IbaG/YrbA [Alteromonadaceae bacterium 2753L.S.0a.02]
MEKQQIIELVKGVIPDAQVEPEGEDCSFTLNVVSDGFSGERPLVRQQKVLSPFTALLQSGELHSLTVKAYTTAEWQKVLESQKSVQIEL